MMLGIILIVVCFLSREAFLLDGWSIYELAVKSITCSCNRSSDLDVSEVNVQVTNCVTRSNKTYPIDEAASEILSSEYFDENQCINIFIPGFNTPVSDRVTQSALCIFCQISCNGKKTLSVIVDHNYYTKGGWNILENREVYKNAVEFVKSIGIAVGKFIIGLLEKVERKNINIIGHSLGAQMLGYVADYVRIQTGIPLDSIYGADPAGPCYKDCPMEHLQKGQAKVVYAFHTTQVLGTNLNIADYDFISYDGKTQKHCPSDLIGMKKQRCGHERALGLALTPAIVSGIWETYKCPDYDDLKDKKCYNNENTLAGYMVNVTGSPGIYYFEPSLNLTCNIEI